MLNPSGLKVTADKILVKMHKVEEKTSGGIILSAATKEKEQLAATIGQVVDWGAQAVDAPELEEITLGDNVLFHRYSGLYHPVDGVDYFVMKASQVLGKIEKLPDFMFKSAESTKEVFGLNDPLKT